MPTNFTQAMSPAAAGRSSIGRSVGLLLAKLLDHLVDLLVGDVRDLEPEGVVGVRAELHVGPHRHGGGEADRLPLGQLCGIDVDVGLIDRRSPPSGRSASSYESLTRWSIASARTLPRPDEAVDDLARRLPRPEPGNLRPLRDMAVRGGEVPVDLVGGNLDLEDHLRPRLGPGRYGDHESPAYGSADDGGRGEIRTRTSRDTGS